MKLQVIIEDNTIAESELIPPGYSIYNLDLKDNIILKKGNYKGKSNEQIEKTFFKLIGVSKFITDDFKKSTKEIEPTYLNSR